MNTAGSSAHEKSHRKGLWLIAVFKLLKGLLLSAVGIGLLTLVNKDVSEVLTHWVQVLHFDPDNRHIHALIARLDLVDDRTLQKISIGTFVYASLLFTESIGLFMQRRWAEYLTVIATSLFIPLELYHFFWKMNLERLTVITINIIIVCYLVMILNQGGKKRKKG